MDVRQGEPLKKQDADNRDDFDVRRQHSAGTDKGDVVGEGLWDNVLCACGHNAMGDPFCQRCNVGISTWMFSICSSSHGFDGVSRGDGPLSVLVLESPPPPPLHATAGCCATGNC